MTPADVAILKNLQDLVAKGFTLSDSQRAEFEYLKRQLAPEQADDPRTLFTDESSRPNVDGTDYNTRLQQIRDEECERIATRVFEKLVEAGLTLVVKR